MAVRIQDVNAAWLDYLRTHSGGGTRAEVMALGVGLGLASGVTNAWINFTLSGAVDLAVIDNPTYVAFAARFSAVGLVRGLTMAGTVLDYTTRTYLVTQDADQVISDLADKKAFILANDMVAISGARTDIAAVSGLSVRTRTAVNRSLTLASGVAKATLDMIDRATQTQIERKG